MDAAGGAAILGKHSFVQVVNDFLGAKGDGAGRSKKKNSVSA